MDKHQDYDFRRILEEMRSEYWRSLEEVEEELDTDTGEIVIVQIGKDRFGLDATKCREVLKLPKIVQVPRVGEQILGIINLRGEIVAVTDLRPILGQAAWSKSADAKLVVAAISGLTIALLVDRIEGIEVFNSTEVEPFTEGLSGVPRDIVQGQIVQGNSMIVLLDLEKTFARSEFVINQKDEEML